MRTLFFFALDKETCLEKTIVKRNCKSRLEKLLYHTVAGLTTNRNYDLPKWPVFTIRFPFKFRAVGDFLFFVELDLPISDLTTLPVVKVNFLVLVIATMLFSERTFSSHTVFEVYQSCDIASSRRPRHFRTKNIYFNISGFTFRRKFLWFA